MANPRGQPLKFPTPESRQKMWQEFCDHISSGLSMKSFAGCDDETAFDYGRKYPEDCPAEDLQEAKRKSLLFWEKIGIGGVTGKIEGFNASTWIFNMKNRAGWADKVDATNTLLGQDGKAVNPNVITIDAIKRNILKAIPEDELNRIIAGDNDI